MSLGANGGDRVPLRVTKEVIGGVIVTRCNGNNPSGSRERVPEEKRWTVARSYQRKAQTKRARIRAKEAIYTRRYLGG